MFSSMNILKSIIFIIGMIFALTISTSIVFSVCKTMPDYVTIYSGSNNLGKFSDGNSVFIKADLSANPIKLEYYLENDESGCYPTTNNFKFKLFSTGAEAIADSVVTNPSGTGTFITKATFNFNVAITVVDPFMSAYTIENTYGSIGIGSFQFLPDNNAPVFVQFLVPSTSIIKSGDEYRVEYYVTDSGSGLELISITGGTSQIINFDSNNNSYQGVFVENPTTSRTYTFKAQDKLGFEATKQINVTVDGVGPTFSNIRKVYTYDGIRKVSFNIDVEDTSFGILTSYVPDVKADFTQINPSVGEVSGNCVKVTQTKFDCAYNNIPITLGATSNVQIRTSATDAIGNYNEQLNTQEIFVDKDGPTISEFYLENSLGVKNKLGSTDSGAKIVLRYTDASIGEGQMSIVEDFSPIQFPSKTCTITGLIGECIYQLGNSVNVFDNFDQNNVTFQIAVADMYGNTKIASANIVIDNIPPVVNNVEFIETESVKDGVIKSGERINFRILVTDSNLFSGQYFIYGDFSQIDFRTGMENLAGSCSLYNSTTVQCDFNNIIAENGYLSRDVIFHVADTAGNNLTHFAAVEIFKINNEVVSSYKISDIYILNPLNRNMVKSSGATGWFEGTLETKDNSMVIVNYQLQGCEEQNLDPIILIDFGMYPDETVVNRGQDNVESFALFFDLKNHPNLDDLNDKPMKCTMAVLKRDSTQIYAPELIEFNVLFSFYDVPGGNLLKRQAANILAMTNEIILAGEWFDSMYKIYHILYQLCNAVTTGGTIMTSVNSILDTSKVFTESSCLTAYTACMAVPGANVGACELARKECIFPITEASKAANKGKDGFMAPLESIMGPVRMACDYVTCNNAGLLLGAIGEVGGVGDEIPGLSQVRDGLSFMKDLQGQAGEFLCTVDGINKAVNSVTNSDSESSDAMYAQAGSSDSIGVNG